MNLSADESHLQIQQNLQRAKDLLKNAQEKQKFYADKKRKELSFSIGDEVLLHSDNITVDNQWDRPSQKLVDRFIGPFKSRWENWFSCL